VPSARAGAHGDLPAVVLCLVHHVGDLVVPIGEHVAQKEHRAFDRREVLEQQQEPHRQRVGRLSVSGGVGLGLGHERFGEPGADVPLAPHPGRPEVVMLSPWSRRTGRPSVIDLGAVRVCR
jgi:hypothetical protein